MEVTREYILYITYDNQLYAWTIACDEQVCSEVSRECLKRHSSI